MNIGNGIGHKTSRKINRTIIYVLLVLSSLMMFFPLFWMVSTSLKSIKEISTFPPIWFPPSPLWENYIKALTFQPFGLYAKNTIIIAIFYILGNVFSATFVGYGFARLRFPGKNTLFMIMLSTMMMPKIVTLIPLFLIFKQLGWINTYLPLTVPAFLGEAFFIFIMRQFFLTIPEDIVDAARIDGASEFGIWRMIMLPLARPAVVSIVIFAFQRTWNDVLSPLIFLTDPKKLTLSVGLISFTAGTGEAVQYWHWMMAASFTMILPMIVIFLIAQKQFVQGVVTSGLKG
ncbi:MAG: carbohydrate ABC transporter permease [Anaerolineales bacterium]|nr:carbohydrate ABC transporter permease [Anaerolineales bacterium]